MSSEKRLIKYYEDYISFKGLVFDRSGLGGYYRATGLTALGLWFSAVVAIYLEQLFTSLFLVFGVGICFVILKRIQVQMVRLVYTELYISPWHWDMEGFEAKQVAFIETYLSEQNIGKDGRAELKRRLEKQAGEIFSSRVILIFLPLVGGLLPSLYPVLALHLDKDLKNELLLFGAFVAVSAVLVIAAYCYDNLTEVMMTKKRIYSQIADLLSEYEITSGK